jgi:hypothetical protein
MKIDLSNIDRFSFNAISFFFFGSSDKVCNLKMTNIEEAKNLKKKIDWGNFV